jgi:hypothetical protein
VDLSKSVNLPRKDVVANLNKEDRNNAKKMKNMASSVIITGSRENSITF